MQPHLNVVAVAGQRLIDGVVHDFIDHVVQAVVVGRADVHARALAHRLQAFQHLDLLFVIGLVHMGGHGQVVVLVFVCH